VINGWLASLQVFQNVNDVPVILDDELLVEGFAFGRSARHLAQLLLLLKCVKKAVSGNKCTDL